MPPGKVLDYMNFHLDSYVGFSSTFVTAFYGIYDPMTKSLTIVRGTTRHGSYAVRTVRSSPSTRPAACRSTYSPTELLGISQQPTGDQIIFYRQDHRLAARATNSSAPGGWT